MNFFASRFGKHEATACDADTPPISITPNNSAGHMLENMPTGSGKAVAKGVSQQSLEDHDKRFHHGHYDGGTCKYREQHGIKTGTSGTGGSATPTASPAPSKPMTGAEKAEITEEDTLSKGATGGQTKPRKGGYEIPESFTRAQHPEWFPKPKSDSGAKEDTSLSFLSKSKPSGGGPSQTDPLGRPVDANGNPIGGRGSSDGEKKKNDDFNAKMRKILEESGMSKNQEENDDGLSQKKNALEDYLESIRKEESRKVKQTSSEGDWTRVDSPSNTQIPQTELTFVQTSIGGTEGFWRTKTEEEMRKEIEENGELKPWKRRFDHTGKLKPEFLDINKPKIKPHVKDFMQKLKGQTGKTRQLVNAAKKSGMTPAEWIDSRMKKLGIKPRFGRLTKNDVQRILEEKSAAEREFEQEDMSNTVAGNVWWMPKSS